MGEISFSLKRKGVHSPATVTYLIHKDITLGKISHSQNAASFHAGVAPEGGKFTETEGRIEVTSSCRKWGNGLMGFRSAR